MKKEIKEEEPDEVSRKRGKGLDRSDILYHGGTEERRVTGYEHFRKLR